MLDAGGGRRGVGSRSWPPSESSARGRWAPRSGACSPTAVPGSWRRPTGRSERTERLADGLELLPSLPDVVAASEIVLSVVPPGEALAVAEAICAAATTTGSRPLVADLNAVSPATAADVAARLAGAGLEAVDGSISGPPPRTRRGRQSSTSPVPRRRWSPTSPRPGSSCASSAPRSERRRRSRCRPRPSTRASRRSSRRRSGRLGRTACSSSCSTISGAAFPTSSTTRRGCSRASRRSPVATSPRWRRSRRRRLPPASTPDLFAAYATIYSGLSTSAAARRTPEEADPDAALDDVLASLDR